MTDVSAKTSTIYAINSRTVLLSKHTATVENQNYYEIVQPLLYITYRDFIYDVIL